MIIILKPEIGQEEIARVVQRIRDHDCEAHLSTGTERTIVGVIGSHPDMNKASFMQLPGVQDVVPISHPHKLASRDFHPEDSVIDASGLKFGGPEIVVIAGPCSVESRGQLLETAYAVKEAGAQALRGGAYKPRTSPYSFEGLGEEGLQLLAEAREETGLPIVTEVLSTETLPIVEQYADILQIGARNMQNYALLHAVGRSTRPVLLKRGMSATTQDLLMAAEHIMSKGNRNVILCERGIRTFETGTRNTTDINAIPVLKSQTHLPIILDPSHSTGHWEYVEAIARAGIAAGADGLIIEVHPHPNQALSDGGQSLKPERFAQLIAQTRMIAEAVGREMAPQMQAVSAPQMANTQAASPAVS